MSLRDEPPWIEINGSRVEVWSDCLRAEVGMVLTGYGDRIPRVVVEVEPDPDPAPDSGRIFVRMMVQN